MPTYHGFCRDSGDTEQVAALGLPLQGAGEGLGSFLSGPEGLPPKTLGFLLLWQGQREVAKGPWIPWFLCSA